MGRNATSGVLLADNKRFPSGIAALASYVHMAGLKFGIRTDRGEKTCGGQPGSAGFEKIDADTFAMWGVDYVKSSSCTGSQVHEDAFIEYGRMYSFLATEDRDIFFAIDGGWSWYAPESFVQHIADSWTVAPDYDNWARYLVNTDMLSHMYGYTGHLAHGWSDGGPLIPSLTPDQRRTQFNIAAVTSSPITIGYDVLNLNPWDEETLTNLEVLAIQQDLAANGAERSVGGPNAQAVPPVWSVHMCNATMPEQQWKLVPVDPNDPSKGVQIFSDNYLPKFCLAALSGTDTGCGMANQQVYEVDCTGPASCRPTSIWMLEPTTGLLRNMATPQQLGNVPGPYATVDKVSCGSYLCHFAGIFLEEQHPAGRPASLRQQWKFDPATKLLSNKVGVSSNGTCVQSTRPTSYNVWGKIMQDGSFVMLFTNNGAMALNVTCDVAKCFGPVHMPLPFPVSVRDLWAHKDIGTIHQGEPFAVQLDANGGSAVFRLRAIK